MVAPTVLRSAIVPILQAIEDRLVAKGVVPDAFQVKWVVGPNPVVPTLDSKLDVLMHAHGPTVQPTCAGRTWLRLVRRLDFIPRTQLTLDPPDRMKAWLSGAGVDGGFFPTEEALIDALVFWVPKDAAGNHIANCDLHLLGATDPIKNTGKDVIGWGWGTVSFQLNYALALTQAYT